MIPNPPEYKADSVINPFGPDIGTLRVLRGGGWFDFAGDVRSAYRYWFEPDGRDDGIGFRLARGHK
jgi:formylglycine-generating enzyme required for sulfatase activity